MSETRKKLFLLDAMALIYRAHFAFSKNPRINSKGFSTGAAFGFTNSLLDILLNEKPSHIGVAIDTKGPTLRHKEFTDYKANRQEQPEDIETNIPWCIKIVEAFNIPLYGIEGFEADDLIGTIAKQAPKDEFDVFMMTPDKDYGQLVEDHIFLYKPAFMGKGVEVMGPNEVMNKWQIERVDQVIDMLGLQGDSVDNIPGIPGVGEKTAQKLLAQYDTVEGVIENAHEIKGKLGEKIRDNSQQGILSKQLATIKIDCPVGFDELDLQVKDFNKDALKEIFTDLEFRTIARRVLGEDIGSTSPKTKAKKADPDQLGMFSQEPVETPIEINETQKTIENTIHDYRTIEGPEEIKELVEYLVLQDEFCFDTETTSISAFEAELVGISISYQKNEGYYIPIPDNEKEAKGLVALLKPAFENDKIVKIGQNIKYDILVLKNYELEVAGPLFDTMLASYLIEPDSRHNMDLLADKYLNYQPVSIESLIGKKGSKQGSMRDVPLNEIKEYATEDADITLQLKQKLEKEVITKGQKKLLNEVETPLIQVLANMEFEGIRVDPNTLKTMSDEMGTEARKLEERIHELAGVPFNINSPKQMGEVLFDKMKIIKDPKKTKTGQYATGEEILTRLAPEHEIVGKILEFREVQKLKSTYIDALPELISKRDGRVHTSFNQTVAATGRLSSTNPNLQNIPIRTERGRAIRKAFIPRSEEFKILSADYSQIELRIMADFSGDKTMIQSFKEGKDIHSITASKINHVSLEEVTGEMRRRAKVANFGIIYGISAFGLSQRLDIPRKEAAALIESYFTEFPSIKKYMDDIIAQARDQEYVETILGRRRYLRDINSRNQTQRGFAERNAINAPIQGSAADLIKIAMININDWMEREKLKSRMLLQVHDELVFDMHLDEEDLLKNKVEELMRNALTLSVPLDVGMGVGENWLEAH